MSLSPTSHPFELWYARHKRDSKTAMPRSKAVAVWNALLDSTVEQICLAKDLFVHDREYESALVALEVKEMLERAKVSAKNPAAMTRRRNGPSRRNGPRR